MNGQNNMELAIGIVFVIVLGAAFFSVLMKDSLPGADSDPPVKVKDSASGELDFEVPLGSTFGTPSSKSNSNKNLEKKDSMPNDTSETTIKNYSKAPEMALEENSTYTATIKTSQGDMTVNLFADQTPITVNNFVFLSREGFYNGTRSHRIIKNFMVQFGDPQTRNVSLKHLWGTGNPGYKFADEPFEGSYSRGVLAMANSGPNTNGSQFFIVHQDTSLPKSYVIFGKITDEDSLTVLDKIANTPVTRSSSGESSLPTTDVLIDSIEIQEN